MMKKKLTLFILMIMTIFACKHDPLSFKGKVVKQIKKDVILTNDGKEINLGGDSISKVYYIIRHAENDTQKIDPPLSANGLQRKIRLNEIFRKTFLNAVYTTLDSKNMMTVDSVAQYKGLGYQIYTNGNIKETFAQLSKSPEVLKILIVGQSNTVPPIANFIYGKNYFNKLFDEKEFDNLIVIVQQRDSSKQIYELKY